MPHSSKKFNQTSSRTFRVVLTDRNQTNVELKHTLQLADVNIKLTLSKAVVTRFGVQGKTR